MDLRRTFDDLVRFETEMWNGIDSALLSEASTSLGSLNLLLVVQKCANCRVNDIAAALAITVGGASQAVDRLEARGLVLRMPNPTNRRSSYIELTPTGIDRLSQAGPVFDRELENRFAAALGPQMLDTFAAALAALRAGSEQSKDTSTIRRS